MLLLLLFAAIAGAGTALSPCVLPILPAVLSAGLAGGRRRPLGVAIGLVLSFALAIALLSELLANLGLGDGTLRTLGIAVVAAAGVTLLAPRLAHAVSAALAPLVRRVPAARGEGFWSGLAVGAALGAVYTPCAGPILAAVIAVGAASSQRVPIAFAYALGSGAVLLAIAAGGRRVTARARGPALQRVLGCVLVVTAVAMAVGLDTRFEAALARHVPAALIDPTGALERSGAVHRRLAAIDDRRPPARAARPDPPPPDPRPA